MALNDVKISLTAEGVAATTAGVDKTADSVGNLGNKTQSATGLMESSWAKMATAFAGGSLIEKAIEKIVEKLIEMKDYIAEAARYAARVDTLGVSMHVVGQNAGYTSGQMDAFEKQVRKMGITTESSRESLTKMAASQMDVTKAADLARVAQDAAVIGGINSSEAFDRMTQGIRSGEVEVLRTIGINVNFENSYKKMADSLGISTNMLTEHQKVLARQNEVLGYGINIQGVYEESMNSTGKKLTSLTRYYDEFKLAFGEAFAPALGELIDSTTEKLKSMLKWFEDNRGALGEFARNLADITKAVAHPVSATWKLVKEPWVNNSYDEAGNQDRTENDQQTRAEEERDKTLKEMARMSKQEAARKAAEAAETKRLADKAAEAEINQYNSFVSAFNSKLRTIEEGEPTLTAHEKELTKIHDEYEKLIETYPKEAAELKKLEKYHIQEAEARQGSADAAAIRLQIQAAEVAMLKDESDYIKKTLDDWKALEDAKALQIEIDLAMINSQEKFNQISSGDAATKRIELLNQSITLLEEQYRLENEQGPQSDLKRLQILQKIGSENAKLLDQQKVLYDATPIGGMTNALQRYADEAANMGKQLEGAFTNAFKGMEDALVKFTMTGKFSFRDMANSIITDLVRIATRQAITGPLAAGLSGLFGGGTIDNYNPNTTYAGASPGPWAPAVMHDGGLVVPRFHSGGLASDEIPAILQTGERVLDREHNAMLERFANKTTATGAAPTINIINNASKDTEVKASAPRLDAGQWVVDMVIQKLRSDPSTRAAFAGGGNF
jgi:lambda family phage tail tape measure protein